MVSERHWDGDIPIYGWILGGKWAEEMGRLSRYIWRVLGWPEYNLWLTQHTVGTTMLTAHRSFVDASIFLLQAIHLHKLNKIDDLWSSGSTNQCVHICNFILFNFIYPYFPISSQHRLVSDTRCSMLLSRAYSYLITSHWIEIILQGVSPYLHTDWSFNYCSMAVQVFSICTWCEFGFRVHVIL